VEYTYSQTDYEGLDAGHRAVVRDNGLSRDARLLFVILNSFASTKDGCYISNGRLAFYMGCTPRATQKWLEELKARKAITVEVDRYNQREIKIVSKIQIVKKPTHEQPFVGVCTDIQGGTNCHSGGHEQRFTRGSRGKEVENRDKSKVHYPFIAQAVKKEGSEAQRKEFFDNYSKWMAYYNAAEPTVSQMLSKLQWELEAKACV